MNWTEYFFNIAKEIAKKSKDPNTKVGAVLVDSSNRIVSTGYNGFPAGIAECPIMWQRPNKYTYVIHAEANAILYAKTDLSNTTLYVTYAPCIECCKMIVASGIRKVYYTGDLSQDSLTFLAACGNMLVTFEKVTLDAG